MFWLTQDLPTGLKSRSMERGIDNMELRGKRVVLLLAEQYDELEVWYPALRLREAGAQVILVGTGAVCYTSKHGLPIQADTSAEQVQPDDFDAIIIPGDSSAEAFADKPATTTLVQTAIQQGKLVAAMSTAGHTVAAHAEGDTRAQRFFGLQEDVLQEKGPLEDSAVIRQGNLIMARTPVDLLAFCRMIMAALADPPTPPTTHVSYG
jgi:protease I